MEPWQLVTGISLLLGIGGTAAGLWATLRTQRRADQTETRSETASMTVITVKLDQISVSLAEVKAEMRGNRDEIRDIRDRLVAVEASAKQAHKRMDQFVGKEG
jgi:hypothetical protein